MSDHPTRRQVIKGAAAVGAAVAGASALAACGDDSGETLTERQQTLFIAGFQWGPPPNLNPLSPTAAWPTAADQMQLDLRDAVRRSTSSTAASSRRSPPA